VESDKKPGFLAAKGNSAVLRVVVVAVARLFHEMLNGLSGAGRWVDGPVWIYAGRSTAGLDRPFPSERERW